MKAFEYSAPKSLNEAASLLSDSWGKAEILAGGSDLVTAMKQRITEPDHLVSLKNIRQLKGVSARGRELRIGAMTTLAELADNRRIRKDFPSLTTAIDGIGSPQIINVGTLGGDLCQRPRCWFFRNGFGLFGKDGDTALVPDGDNRYHAIFGNSGDAKFVSASSLGPALIALDATIAIHGADGDERTVSAASFFQTPKTAMDRETALKPNEILTAVLIPITKRANATYEVRHRTGLDWPYVTASVSFDLNDGKAQNARVVLGHVAPTPWPVDAAAKALNGAVINESSAAKAGEMAAQNAKPLSKNAYKIQLVKAAVKRAALAAVA